MNKKIPYICLKLENNQNRRPHKETASKQQLRTFRSFMWTNNHVYEKCRHFRRG